MILTDDLRCVFCDGDLSADAEGGASALKCHGCGRRHPIVLGVPFIGDFERADVPGLIEIAANLVHRGRFGMTPERVEQWESLLNDFHETGDRAAFLAALPEDLAAPLPNRYGEWVEVRTLSADMELAGRKVLDIGAGLGFDSHRLALRGAEVTALEFSPVLCEAGAANFPHIRWIGGFSHCLPFRSGSFDAVFCNAALHHMRDIPLAVAEALRVLKPGGTLVTTCDSFRPSGTADAVELAIFASDTVVLQGVNEQVPPFDAFLETLIAHRENLDATVFSHVLYGADGTVEEDGLREWSLEAAQSFLAHRSGSLAMKIRLRSALPLAPQRQTRGVLPPDRLVRWLEDDPQPLARLAGLVEAEQVDLPLVNVTGSKFELLNGWRASIPYQHGRTAYRRGRWFLRRPEGKSALAFDLSRPARSGSVVESVAVFLNGKTAGIVKLEGEAYVPVRIDLASVPTGAVFCLELVGAGPGAGLEAEGFEASNRRFIAPEGEAGPPIPHVFVVIPVFNRLQFTRDCICCLKRQSYRDLTVIVADGGSTDGTQDAIRKEFPDVVLLTSERELWWAGSTAMGIEHALKAGTVETDAVLMLNNDTLIPDDYVERLVSASLRHDAAVGAMVVDSRNPEKVLDAGEFIDWSDYSFPVRDHILPMERFCDGVDVVPGRGSLVPLRMIRAAGNVDEALLPHYLADYEFAYRIKSHGFRLGVCYETAILAHVEETGIVPGAGTDMTFRQVWREAFSRRSMANVMDHWRFVARHAPEGRVLAVKSMLVRRVIFDFLFRTRLRPLGLLAIMILRFPHRIWRLFRGQTVTFERFLRAWRSDGRDVLCRPQDFPGAIRLPLYLAAAPGPFRPDEATDFGLVADDLVARGIAAWQGDRLVLRRLRFDGLPDASALAALARRISSPLRKGPGSIWWSTRRERKAGTE